MKTINFKEYIKLCESGQKPVVLATKSKPLPQRKTPEELALINKLKVPALNRSEQVYLDAINLLKRKHNERIDEIEALDVELNSTTLHKSKPQVDIEGYFQKLLKLADNVACDIEAEKKLSSEINAQTIRDLASKERLFADKPDTDTAKEFHRFRKVFIKHLGTEPSEAALKKLLNQGFQASKVRMQESLFQKGLSLIKGKSFNRLMSECILKTGNEDTLTEIQLKPLIKIEQKSQPDITANRILNFKEYHEL